MVYQFTDTFILCRRDWYNRDSKQLFQFVHTNRTTILAHLIHHVKRQNHRHIQLQKLHSQIQISLNIGSIYNIDDSLWMFFQHELSGHDLFAGIG